jgi:hypothetical protein
MARIRISRKALELIFKGKRPVGQSRTVWFMGYKIKLFRCILLMCVRVIVIILEVP